MLAAVLPAGTQAWFFKVVGPLAAVEKQAAAVNAFFESVHLGDDGRPAWKLPADWQEEQGTGMRAATIRIPADGAPLELTVIGLPWRGTPGELLSNINRWRGQMKLPEVGQQQLAEFTREVEAGGTTMTVVDMRGQFEAGSAMTAPFAGGAGSGESDRSLPPGHPPIDGLAPTNQSPPPAAAAPKFKTPEGWQPLPAGGFRKAAFQIGSEQEGALVTVIDFPADAGPMIADPLQNVNRWRQEVGMPPIDAAQLDENVEPVEIDGHPASYAKLIPEAANSEDSHAPRATLAALVDSGQRIWFFKMSGNREVVAEQQDEFKSFLDSVQFAAQQGGHDGNR
jgi:hypothetical protein